MCHVRVRVLAREYMCACVCVPVRVIYIHYKMGDYWTPPNGFPKHGVHIYMAHLILNIYMYMCVCLGYIIYIQDKMGDYWTPLSGFPKHGVHIYMAHLILNIYMYMRVCAWVIYHIYSG